MRNLKTTWPIPFITYIYHKNQPNAGKYTIHSSLPSAERRGRCFFEHVWQSRASQNQRILLFNFDWIYAFVVKVAFWTSGFAQAQIGIPIQAHFRATGPRRWISRAMTRLILALAALSHVVDSAGKVPRVGWCHLDQFPSVDWRNVITSMGILCLVNCFCNLHIRKASWNLLSTTVSIFSAASFDFSIYRLIQLPFETSEHNMESHWEFVFWLGVWCLAVFVIVHTLLLKCDQRHCLAAITTLGSHIYAFASILVFGNMQKWHCTPSRPLTTTTTTQKWHCTQKWEIIWVWSVPVLAFCVMVLMFFAFFRQCHRNKMKKMKINWKLPERCRLKPVRSLSLFFSCKLCASHWASPRMSSIPWTLRIPLRNDSCRSHMDHQEDILIMLG